MTSRFMQKRVILVDFAHMVHTFYHSGFGGSVTVIENGVPEIGRAHV